MNPSARRNFLKIFLLHSGFWLLWTNAKISLSKENWSQETALIFRQFLDALIPEDITPSASQVNLDNDLLEHASKIRNYEKLIALGCQWLNSQSNIFYKLPFINLNLEQKNKIVEVASNSHTNTIPGQFFNRIRQDAYIFYYAKPASWQGLIFSRPPQPQGYPDYAESPSHDFRK